MLLTLMIYFGVNSKHGLLPYLTHLLETLIFTTSIPGAVHITDTILILIEILSLHVYLE